MEGPHAAIGAEIASRYGVTPTVCNAIAAHHQEVEQETTEATVVQIADAISASRPGARGENLDNYVKRLDDLQQIALSFPAASSAASRSRPGARSASSSGRMRSMIWPRAASLATW